jgi:hypothetical protein
MDALLEGNNKKAVKLTVLIVVECCGTTSIFAPRVPLLLHSLGLRGRIHVADEPIVLTECPLTSKENKQSPGNT